MPGGIVTDLRFLGELFEPLAEVVFCAKDSHGRYAAVNAAFLARVGRLHRDAVLGRTARDLFPPRLAEGYEAQDLEVLRSGEPMRERLERITNTDGSVGWYLTSKHPLPGPGGAPAGILSVSQDLHTPSGADLHIASLAAVVEHIRAHLDEPLRVDALASMAGLSPTRFDRRMRRLFRLSPKQFVVRARVERAVDLLEHGGDSLGEIALACGFTDQSAFSRQFKATTGLTPGEFRRASAVE